MRHNRYFLIKLPSIHFHCFLCSDTTLQYLLVHYPLTTAKMLSCISVNNWKKKIVAIHKIFPRQQNSKEVQMKIKNFEDNKLTESKITKFLLTYYQMTNFRLFQTERVCRQHFRIWRKCKKVIQMGRKHCGKRRNCSLRAISPFPTVFSIGLFPRGVKRCHCVWMG